MKVNVEIDCTPAEEGPGLGRFAVDLDLDLHRWLPCFT